MTTITLQITDEVAQLLEAMLETRSKDTLEILAQRCFEAGVKVRAYRASWIKKTQEKKKFTEELIESLKSDPKFKEELEARMKELNE